MDSFQRCLESQVDNFSAASADRKQDLTEHTNELQQKITDYHTWMAQATSFQLVSNGVDILLRSLATYAHNYLIHTFSILTGTIVGYAYLHPLHSRSYSYWQWIVQEYIRPFG